MNRKTIILLSCIAAVLTLGIAAAVYVLYYDQSAPVSRVVKDRGALHAVPSDAVALMTFSSLDKAVEMLSNKDLALDAFVTSTGKYSLHRLFENFSSDGVPAALKSSQTAVSLQYNGSFSALMAISCPSLEDTSAVVGDVLARAQRLGLKSKAVPFGCGSLVLFSPSEADIVSSTKHIAVGASILDQKSFCRALDDFGGRDGVWFSNQNASRSIPVMVKKPYNSVSSFLSSLGNWTVMGIPRISEDGVLFDVWISSLRGVAYFKNVLEALPASECRLFDIAPAKTLSAVGLCLDDCAGYVSAYDAYRDACGEKKDISKAWSWADEVGICEIAALTMMAPGKNMLKAVAARSSSMMEDSDSLSANNHNGYIASLFGDSFKLEDESFSAVRGGWIISGSKDAVSFVLSSDKSLSESLEESGASDIIPAKVCGPLVYCSIKECDPDQILREPFAGALKRSISGSSFAPMVVSSQKEGWKVDIARASRLKAVPTDFKVPSGPFTVKNCGTGRMNTLVQNADNSLSLRDKDGSTLWTMPLETPLCGRVAQVDFFHNGKIQYLFCCGSSLYLVDRLGRTVNGFPVKLEKEVLLGPDSYDFTGGKGYNILVLSNDNTIDMYNLQGRKPASWKGITCPDPITTLPVLKKTDSGKKYWSLTVDAQTYTYDFWGGESQKID